MGHDIFAINKKGESLAHMYRGAFSSCNRAIYAALGCLELYNGISGNGETKEFDQLQIESALGQLDTLIDYSEEVRFLKECLNIVKENNTITIVFA